MRPPGCIAALLLSLCLASPAGAGDPATLPVLESAPGNAFTPAERDAIAAWTLAQPEVVAALGDHRTRLLRLGSDQPKGRDGVYRRATLFVRDYDSGFTHEIQVNLETAEVKVREYKGLAQPSEEEIQEAWSILLREPDIAVLFEDPQLEVSGGFFTRSAYPDDPCFRDVCLRIEIARRRPGQGFAKRMVVNLTRGEIAHREYRADEVPGEPARLTDPRNDPRTDPRNAR